MLLQNGPRLRSAAAAQFRDDEVRRQRIDHVSRMRLDHAGIGAREAVFRQVGDGFEKSRTDVVVQIAAGQGLLPGAREPRPHFAREFVVQRRCGHQDSTSRKVA